MEVQEMILDDALNAYDVVARTNHQGVSRQTLDRDGVLLIGMGKRLREIAEELARVCTHLNWTNERPTANRLLTLLAESIDGELSAEAWGVIFAAAQKVVV